ncbi:hypothetical protein G6F60_013988 [Rhizopus arrhizus]|nr:hypothetical protein G6F60_013988 [Rhizopus arrhizus]
MTDQRTGDPHRPLAQRADDFVFPPHQRPAEVVEDARELRGEASHLGLALAIAFGSAAAAAVPVRAPGPAR